MNNNYNTALEELIHTSIGRSVWRHGEARGPLNGRATWDGEDECIGTVKDIYKGFSGKPHATEDDPEAYTIELANGDTFRLTQYEVWGLQSDHFLVDCGSRDGRAVHLTALTLTDDYETIDDEPEQIIINLNTFDTIF